MISIINSLISSITLIIANSSLELHMEWWQIALCCCAFIILGFGGDLTLAILKKKGKISEDDANKISDSTHDLIDKMNDKVQGKEDSTTDDDTNTKGGN